MKSVAPSTYCVGRHGNPGCMKQLHGLLILLLQCSPLARDSFTLQEHFSGSAV